MWVTLLPPTVGWSSCSLPVFWARPKNLRRFTAVNEGFEGGYACLRMGRGCLASEPGRVKHQSNGGAERHLLVAEPLAACHDAGPIRYLSSLDADATLSVALPSTAFNYEIRRGSGSLRVLRARVQVRSGAPATRASPGILERWKALRDRQTSRRHRRP